MNNNLQSMFERIKGSLSDQKTKNNVQDILQLKPGNIYTVRLLPYTENPENTFFHYYIHGWNSFATGQYVSAVSPQTYGEPDPIAEERYRVYRTGTVEEKEKAKHIIRSEKWLVNVYVIDDPTNPENNGQVKILRHGKQLNKIIIDALQGEEATEFGPKIFDLGPDGADFKIKVEKQGDFPSYVTSRFTTATKLKLEQDEIDEILGKAHDLSKIFTIRSYSDLNNLLEQHYHCRDNQIVESKPKQEIKTAPVPDNTTPTEDDNEESFDVGFDPDEILSEYDNS